MLRAMAGRVRVAVVTGGGGDMGLACARRLGARGLRLCLAEFAPERLARARAELEKAGHEVTGVPCDVSDPQAIGRLARTAAGLGEIGALVHTAGLSPTMADGRRIVEVNLIGTALLVEAFLPLARRGTAAVLIASQAGHFSRNARTPQLDALLDAPLRPGFLEALGQLHPTYLGLAAYGVSKYGVLRLAIRESVRWGARGARIVSLSPGIIDTGMGRQEYAAQPLMKTLVERTPLGRQGTAQEIASAVDFLCSDDASFITGTDLLVDGGATEQVNAMFAHGATDPGAR
jgi:NAD(P)-dependent dehydrogenase (short-subunit alcohol dehydrogenase family)